LPVRQARGGFTLIESLVALALVAVGLLLAVGIQMQPTSRVRRPKPVPFA
jgi:prepilin-type N-terminal cleavage/methylation domain-containing protein